MNDWLNRLRLDPLPRLLSSANEALQYFARRDLLEEEVGPIERLWELPEPSKLIRKQQQNGFWRYPGKSRKVYPYINYGLLETFRNLRLLVEKYGFNRDHSAMERAADYVFSCQAEEGDIRGILGNQHMPYYHGAIMELLIKAGYVGDPQIEQGFKWLLSMRQDDGGWIIPVQAIPAKEKTEELWQAPPVTPDRSKPFSHLATGMVLRAFAAHPRYRKSSAAKVAGKLLKSRFFRPDRYNDRKAPAYWTKFQYPFWWPNLLTALDSLSLLGFPADDPDIEKGLKWFLSNQREDGLWDTGYGKAKDREMNLWVGLAVCRTFRSFSSDLLWWRYEA